MGWERRGNGQYYYQKIRIGEKVKSIYIGRGAASMALGALMEFTSKCVKGQHRLPSAKRQLDGLERQIRAHDELTEALVDAFMITSGYRWRGAEWKAPPGRPRRLKNSHSANDECTTDD